MNKQSIDTCNLAILHMTKTNQPKATQNTEKFSNE